MWYRVEMPMTGEWEITVQTYEVKEQAKWKN